MAPLLHPLLLFLSILVVSSAAAAEVEAADPLILQVVPDAKDERGVGDLGLGTVAVEEHFMSFERWFGRSYASAEERVYQRSMFAANLRCPRRHQRLDPDAVHSVTQFSGLTLGEFRRGYLGFRQKKGGVGAAIFSSSHEAPILPTNDLPSNFVWTDHDDVSGVKNQVHILSICAFYVIYTYY